MKFPAHNGFKNSLKPFNYKVQAKKDGKKVENAADADTTVIDVDGFIGSDWWAEMWGEEQPNTIEAFKEKLRAITTPKVILNINSLGGDLNHGLVIMEMLQSKQVEVVTNMHGFNASAATCISNGGTKRRMSENGFMLIHRSMFGVCDYLNKNSLKAMLENAETIDTRMVAMYKKRSKMKETDIITLMDAGEGYGKWIDAETALSYGLIDAIYDPADTSDPDTDHLAGSAESTSTSKKDDDKYRMKAELATMLSGMDPAMVNKEFLNSIMDMARDSEAKPEPSPDITELTNAVRDARRREIEIHNINQMRTR